MAVRYVRWAIVAVVVAAIAQFFITRSNAPQTKKFSQTDLEGYIQNLEAWSADTGGDDRHAEFANSSLYWGTYRPSLYFGTRTRSANALLTGLGWFGMHGINDLRHTCDQNHGLAKYGWTQHDGRSFGSQEIVDQSNNIILKTQFIKLGGGSDGGDWAVRISGQPIQKRAETPVSLFFYIASDEGSLKRERLHERELHVVTGRSGEVGEFALYVFDGKFTHGSTTTRSESFFWGGNVGQGNQWRADEIYKNVVMSSLRARKPNYQTEGVLFNDLVLPDQDVSSDPNLYIFQQMLGLPFQVDLVFLSGFAHEDLGLSTALNVSQSAFNEKFGLASAAFDLRFKNTFGLASKGFNDGDIQFAEAAISNMLGSLGYFHGDHIVDRGRVNEETGLVEEPNEKREGPHTLFTAVPSRPFFPRGFVWDEGFHQLLISAWDSDLSLDLLGHWTSLIEESGWLAREQILGDEARSKVPREFQTQYPGYANPPFLMSSLAAFINRAEKPSEKPGFASRFDGNLVAQQRAVRRVYDRLRKYYRWFVQSQKGVGDKFGRNSRGGDEAFRWRGRTPNHCLTSGLDDYPRAANPDAGELHVDLLSWVGWMSRVMARAARFIGENNHASEYESRIDRVKLALHDLHWNSEANAYCDCTVDEGENVFVVHKGYVSLFPLILGLVEVDAPQVGSVLEMIRDENQLWTPFGIASLSQEDPLFGTGENYWRGAIWININYLLLGALHEARFREY
ncbi:glycoside hydrolase [Cladochytrium replicatum]|nr:glycoside hydrolase [Cladochytrium replicatum]